MWAYTRATGARSMSRAGRKRGSERRDASESEREHTCVTRDLFCVWPVVGVLYGVRVCDFSCIKSVWVAQKRPNFPARASRRSQKFLVSLGARAENGELALVKCTKVKSITSILPDLRVSLAAEGTSDRTNSKKSAM